jgi:hypothetical protein
MTGPNHVASPSLELTWAPEIRVAVLRFAPGITLGEAEGALLVDSLAGWIGASELPFGLLADTNGVRGADAAYRARTREFFEQNRGRAFVAVTNMGPVISVVADLFRIGTGIQLKGFPDESSARAWLRSNGVAA